MKIHGEMYNEQIRNTTNHMHIQEKTAIIFEPNDPTEECQRISYKELHSKVCKFSNVLKKNNIVKGDRVCLYMPMVPVDF